VKRGWRYGRRLRERPATRGTVGRPGGAHCEAEARARLFADRARLRARLESAILARYLPESAVRRHDILGDDPQVKKALEILVTSPAEYDAALLRPTNDATARPGAAS